MSKARLLTKGSTWNTASFALQALATFFLIPFIVYSLGDRLYGFWTLVGAFIGYYGLMDLGLAIAVNRHIAGAIGAGDTEESNRVFNTAFPIYLLMGAAALVVTVTLAVFARHFIADPDEVRLFRIVVMVLGVNMALEFPMRVFIGLLSANLRFDIISGTQMLTTVLRTALTVLVLVAGYKLIALALVTALSGLPAKVLLIYHSFRNMPSLRFDQRLFQKASAKNLLTYSTYSFLSKISDQLRFNLDSVVISAFIGLAAVTHYKIAATLVVYYRTLISTMLGVFFPRFSQIHGSGDHEGLKKSFLFSTKLAICAASFIGFGLMAWGRPFIIKWMGPDYLDAYPVLLVLVIGAIVELSQCPSPALLFATSNHKPYAIYSMFEGVVNLGLSLVLVHYYGLVGVALGTLIPILMIKLVIQPILVSKVINITYGEYTALVLKTLGLVWLSLGIPAVITYEFVKSDYFVLMLIGFVSFLIFALSIWRVAFSQKERDTMQETFFPKLLAKRSAG